MLKGKQIFFIGQDKIEDLEKSNPKAFQLVKNLSDSNNCFYLNPYGSYLKGVARLFNFSNLSDYTFSPGNNIKVLTIYNKLSETIYHETEFFQEQSAHIRNVLEKIQKKYKFYKPIIISFNTNSIFNSTINTDFVQSGTFQYIDKSFAEITSKKNKKYQKFLDSVDGYIFDRFQIEDIMDISINIGDHPYFVLQECIDYKKYNAVLDVNQSIPNNINFCIPFNLTRDLVDIKLFSYVYNQFPANKWIFYSKKIDGVFKKFLKKKKNYEIIDTSKAELPTVLAYTKFVVLPFPTSISKEFAEQIIFKCFAAGIEVACTQFDGYEYSDSKIGIFDKDTTKFNKSTSQEFVNYMKNKIITNQPAKALQRSEIAKQYGWEKTLDNFGDFISRFKIK
jgi:hypothetical protein